MCQFATKSKRQLIVRVNVSGDVHSLHQPTSLPSFSQCMFEAFREVSCILKALRAQWSTLMTEIANTHLPS